jgi:RNA polymerase sigma factor (sigma-70 family)
MRDAHRHDKLSSPKFTLRVSHPCAYGASRHTLDKAASPRLPPGRLRAAKAVIYIGRYQARAAAMLRRTALQRRATSFATKIGNQSESFMTDAPSDPPTAPNITQILLAQRSRILHFLRLRGAGDAAEDIYQELWMRLSHRAMDHIADPASYVMRAANNLMLDRYRSQRQRDLRDMAWGELSATTEASAENRVIAHQQLQKINEVIDAVGARPAHIFRRFRLDAVQQKDIAAEMSLSLSTVEADLRKVYAAIAATRRQFDAP